jgi:hypothetical protein
MRAGTQAEKEPEGRNSNREGTWGQELKQGRNLRAGTQAGKGSEGRNSSREGTWGQELKQRRNLRAGTQAGKEPEIKNSSREGAWGWELKAEAMEQCCILTCSWWLAQPAFLGNLGPPVQEWPQPQWAGPSPVNLYLRKSPMGLSTAGCYGGSLSVGVPSSPVTLVCAKLT